MGSLKFSVDAKLLRELGERLVGRPHIALAELIKNAYDADAHRVELTFEADQIRVVDDGHGMDADAFLKRWMRIGVTTKADEQVSPALQRPLTGSKGVGRLSAQLLAGSLELRSVGVKRADLLWSSSRVRLAEEIHASVNWKSAQERSDLTDVEVEFDSGPAVSRFAGGSRHGTAIVLTDLNMEWGPRTFEDLAREIWALQSPFADDLQDRRQFTVQLTTPYPEVQESFDRQMAALMSIPSAIIKGRLLAIGEAAPPKARRIPLPRVDLEEEPSEDTDDQIELPPRVTSSSSDVVPARRLLITIDLLGSPAVHYAVDVSECHLAAVDFEIRVFDLINRQPKGIKVETARRYLAQFGGVRIYDTGFRLPYYGSDVDWLRLELDHARRLSRSALVPEDLQVRNAMQDLPPNKRIFGAVNVSTSAEQRAAARDNRPLSEALAIQITRDRLADNAAYRQLRTAVRLSIDLYAIARAASKTRDVLQRRRRRDADPSEAIKAAAEALERAKADLPTTDYETLRDSLNAVAMNSEVIRAEARAYASLLGALATAGMTSLAYEHEVSKQRREVQAVARALDELAGLADGDLRAALSGEAIRLREWSKRAKRIRALFAPLLSEEARTSVERFDAAKVVRDVVGTMSVLARGATIDYSDVPAGVLLPAASYAAWMALLQNLLTNAFRATLDATPSLVKVDAEARSGRGWLRVQNNGVQVDLNDCERLFLPFERDDSATERSEALGLGGSGLGLTIVRMIADEIRCKVRFVAPDEGWSTSIIIEWKDERR